MEEISEFDVSNYLDSDEMIAEYLTASLEEEDPSLFLIALGNAAKAKGMGRIAKDAGLGRESLYKSLAPGAKPRFETVQAVLKSLGVKMQFAVVDAAVADAAVADQ